ncbi:MAG: hypothetical protein MJ248_04845 [Bacilli bacterium]|nr:hypothetical protein [Bacilli bacterium]
MNKKLLFSASGISLLIAGALAVQANQNFAIAKAETSSLTLSASNFERSNGAPGRVVSEDITNGVQINGLHSYKAEMASINKIRMDGFYFEFGMPTYREDGAVGFYFSQINNDYHQENHMISLWGERYISGQTRVYVANGLNIADPDYSPTCYTGSDFTEAGFGVADSCYCEPAASHYGAGTPEIHGYLFMREDESTWSLRVCELDGTSWVKGANCNAGNDSLTGKFVSKVFLKNSDVTYVDESLRGYLHIVAAGTPYDGNDDYQAVAKNAMHYDTPTDEVAKKYLDGMDCDATGINAPVKNAAYDQAVSMYGELPSYRQNELKAAAINATNEYGDDKVQEFGYRYAYLVAKYGDSYDFMNIGSQLSSTNKNIFGHNSSTLIITITSLTTITFLAGAITLKKKRHN